LYAVFFQDVGMINGSDAELTFEMTKGHW